MVYLAANLLGLKIPQNELPLNDRYRDQTVVWTEKDMSWVAGEEVLCIERSDLPLLFNVPDPNRTIVGC